MGLRLEPNPTTKTSAVWIPLRVVFEVCPTDVAVARDGGEVMLPEAKDVDKILAELVV